MKYTWHPLRFSAILGPALLLALSLGAASSLLLTAAPARATVVRQMSVEDMAERATVVVRGVVEAQRAVYEDGHIDTRLDVQVAEWLKSPSRVAAQLLPSRVQVSVPGGQVGELAQTVSGAPRFSTGDEVVVFLWQRSAGEPFVVLGLAQGSFKVERAAATVEAVSDRRGLSAARLQAPAAGAAEHEEGTVERLPLAELEARVRAHVRAMTTSAIEGTR